MNKTEYQVVTLNWDTARALVSPVRRQVFIQEQQVAEELEWDGLDNDAHHAAALTDDNQVLGCGRLLSNGQVGRMAVLAEYRRHGIGGSILLALENLARQQHYPKLFLHAQLQALPFYKKFGYDSQGEIFYEADIPHRIMNKHL